MIDLFSVLLVDFVVLFFEILVSVFKGDGVRLFEFIRDLTYRERRVFFVAYFILSYYFVVFFVMVMKFVVVGLFLFVCYIDNCYGEFSDGLVCVRDV